MGDEITKATFDVEDFERFTASLHEETALACAWLRDGRMSEQGFTVGFELEAWLLDHGNFPYPINETFLQALDDPLVVPELSRFNVEFNCAPQRLEAYALRTAEQALADLWARSNAVAHGLNANILMIGTLPTIRERDLSLSNMSPLKRYYALNNEVLRRRGGEPLRIDIAGHEHLMLEHADVMLEAATTSLQVHLKTPLQQMIPYFNASILASGPVLAACGNSPFLFGKALWEETRVPVFEQAVALDGRHEGLGRVTFGKGYLADSAEEWLHENLHEYQVLLPLCCDEPVESLRHLRLHNGTIWRWNRPLLGFDDDGTPHIRIEQRILPAGPSFIDMIANAALYIGLVHAIVEGKVAIEATDFAIARANFYTAARDGLKALLEWDGRWLRADQLLRGELLPAAHRGLTSLGIPADERERYLGVIAARIANGQTGAAWQRECLKVCNGDWFKLVATYAERQRSGAPVHEWEL